MGDVLLKLILDNKDVIKGLKDTQAETQKLTDNVKELEKQHRQLFDTMKNKGFSDINKLKEYEQKMKDITSEIEKNERALQELNKTEKEENKSKEESSSSLKDLAGKYGTVVGAMAAVGIILAKLKTAFLETAQGIKIFNQIGAATKQVLADIVNGTGISITKMTEAIRLAGKMEEIRKQTLVDTFKGTQIMAEYNKRLTEANDKLKTNEERILLLTQAKWLHNKAIDAEIAGTEEQLNAVKEGLRLQPTNDKLLTQFAELNTKLADLSREREAGQRRIVGQMTSLMEEEFNKQKDIYDKTVDMIRKAADEQIEINEQIQKENERLDKEFAEGKMAFDKKMRDERSSQGVAEFKRLEKDNQDKIKSEKDKLKEQIAIDKKYYQWFWDQSEKLKKKEQKDTDEARDKKIANLEAIAQAVDSASQFTMSLYDNELTKLEWQADSQMRILDAKYRADINSAGRNAKQKEKIEKEYNDKRFAIELELDTKRRAIARKAAIAEKISGLFSIGINTAVAITKEIPNVLLMALAAAAGALQFATVAAKPVPQFAKGGWTGSGTYKDSSGERIAGVVHEKEFVVKRGPAYKFREVLEAINKDDRTMIFNKFNKFSPDLAGGTTVNNVVVENEGPNKRLDAVISEQRKLNAKLSNESIQSIGNVRIIRKGSNIRTVKR